MQEVFEKIIDRFDELLRVFPTNSKDNFYRGNGFAYKNAIKIVQEVAKKYNNGWISVSERLPEDGDCRFYMCIVENHEEDEPMLCQYDELRGFGFYHDIYDKDTLGFVDSEFETNEEIGYEKVIAWQQIPEYQLKGDKE